VIGVAAGLVLVAAMLAVDGVGRPAAAEVPAGDTESTVTSVEPPTPAIDVRVIGGDETVRLDVDPGHEVVVLGYLGEPYLRIDPSGDVYENQRSPAVSANADRYSTGAPQPSADAGAAPEWALVGSGGTFEWHDHRMHWMTEAVPAPGEPGDLVFAWTIDLTVDGAPVAVGGELRRGAASAAWPWFVLAAAVAAIGLVIGLRRRAAPVAVAAAAAVTAIAVALTVGERVALECWSCGRLFDLLPVAVAVVAVVVMAVVRSPGRRLAAAAVALVALTGWLLIHLRALTRPVVVSAWPDAAVRGAVAVALGVGVAGLVLAALDGRRALDDYASRPPSQRRSHRRRRGAATPA
jgi:hypothetical protein